MKFKTYEYIQDKSNNLIILWFMYMHREDELTHTLECIRRETDAVFNLIAVQVHEWNEDLSPWKHELLDDSFAGNGVATRKILMDEIVPEIKEKYGSDVRICLMGYSLAGLFALWTLCEEEAFAGAICCSGSLWYPGFVDYLRSHIPANKTIYLSLGGKESRTNDALMANVGTATKDAVAILKEKNSVIFVENPGGHFADAGKRLAKGVNWILKKN